MAYSSTWNWPGMRTGAHSHRNSHLACRDELLDELRYHARGRAGHLPYVGEVDAGLLGNLAGVQPGQEDVPGRDVLAFLDLGDEVNGDAEQVCWPSVIR
jgi:hypothetical protein